MECLTSTLGMLAIRLGAEPDRSDALRAPIGSGPGAAASDAVVPRLIAMPLDVFAHAGQWIEVRVPWLAVTLWFVPAERDAERLVWEGVRRGRVWTAGELSRVMAITGPGKALRTIALAKLTFDGDIVEVAQQRRG